MEDKMISKTKFQRLFESIEAKYSDMPQQALYNALNRTGLFDMYTANPYIQNERVRAISTLPNDYKKDDIVKFLLAPDGSEQQLRAVSGSLTYTAYPYYKLIKTYADILTYRHYSYPCYLETVPTETSFMREWRLVEKISSTIKPEQLAHQIAMQCAKYGKTFYTLRKSIDKSHNTVNYAFVQEMPQDYCKIVGFNNITKYTVAFNMMYFEKEGTDPAQFGDLFAPYLDDFAATMQKDKKIVTASKDSASMSLAKLKSISKNAAGHPEVYYQGGKWFWWVTLPPDAIWTFECDDSNRTVTPPLAGLILSMSQIAQYENLQLELLSNPLVACLHGEMEYADTNGMTPMEDAYKLSPSGRAFFEALWYQMLQRNNTSGIGFFAAPLKNMKLEQLQEVPSATDVSAKGYAYTIMKSGSGIINATTEPRVGMVDISAKIESQFMRCIYRTFENMMNWIYASVDLKHEWRFKMFGDIFSEQKDIESCRAGMSLGILADTLKYDAIMGHSLLDDLSISNAIIGLDIVSKRIPLKTSYTASGDDEKKTETTKSEVDNKGGRPTDELGDIESEGNEESFDAE